MAYVCLVYFASLGTTISLNLANKLTVILMSFTAVVTLVCYHEACMQKKASKSLAMTISINGFNS